MLRVVHCLPDLLLVDDAREEVVLSHQVEFLVRKVQDPQAIDMREGDVVLGDEFLKLVDYLLDRTPTSNVCSLETNKLLLSIQDFALLDDKLRLINIGTSVRARMEHPFTILISKSIIIMIKILWYVTM
jgi:hypothetical protein